MLIMAINFHVSVFGLGLVKLASAVVGLAAFGISHVKLLITVVLLN